MTILKSMQERLLFADGGMGSLLQSRGLEPGKIGDLWNIDRPEDVIEIQSEYLKAGSDILTANTFNTNQLKFPEDGTYSVENIITAAIRNARAAMERVPSDRARYVALDIGPTGKLLQPLGDLSFDDAYAIFARNVRAGVKAGADLVLIETMNDTYEIKAAVLAAKENSDLPVFVTVTFDENGQLLTGCDIKGVIAMLEGLRVDAIGMNCGLGPVQMQPLLDTFLQYTSLPVIMNPNAGLPRTENGQTVYDIDIETYTREMEQMVRKGIRVAGGCCGTTPAYIASLTRTCRPLSTPMHLEPKQDTIVSSYAKSVVISDDPVIIGERINPTGKKKLKAALKDRDMSYILNEAVRQQQSGAHILDVNVGLPGIDEVALLKAVMMEVQSVSDLPLQLDTSNPEAMEQALRYYNGKPMINSVSGKVETMEKIFPLVQKYGGTVVCLCLDDAGIPQTADERVAIARKIRDTAATYGIPAKDLIIDGLAMTISANSQSALVTLETIRRVHDELHMHTILGVSNISFGLPARENINSHFLTMAMQNGLSAAIINPGSEAMMTSYYAFRALAGLDDNSMDYIKQFADVAPASKLKVVSSDVSLSEAIRNGLKEAAAQAARKALTELEPLTIIDNDLIPALNQVGEAFEKKTLFLPQLLMSADAAKAAFDEIRSFVKAQGTPQESKGTIVIATVKDDIHDIGKNIVRTLLENYGYDVIDLGRDVPPETILQAVQEHNARLCGLSALMTTTVPHMEETIRLLHEKAPYCKIMVGGAVLTQEYADEIHADFYGKDAMASVRYAETVFNQ